MYQERRFTKLGTTAACVVKSIDLYNKLLEQTSKKYTIFILCNSYCAYFAYKIGMPHQAVASSFLPLVEGPADLAVFMIFMLNGIEYP